MSIIVESAEVNVDESFIESTYVHKFSHYNPQTKRVKVDANNIHFKTEKKPGKVGLLMVGFGGNNGSTILGGILANKNNVTWNTKKGKQTATMYGSMTQCSTMKVAEGEDGEVFLPIKEVIPLIEPTDLVIGGWDINSLDLAEAM
jgi:myo-inositol-1-phosphate synthase